VSTEIVKFEDEGNLIFLVDVEVLGDGHTVCHARTLWCEAVDREHARYITFALNKVGVQEVMNGSRQNDI